METFTNEKLIYSCEKKENGFVFKICEGKTERAVLINGISDAAAQAFLNVLEENDVRPEHLCAVAEDYEFAEILILSGEVNNWL